MGLDSPSRWDSWPKLLLQKDLQIGITVMDAAAIPFPEIMDTAVPVLLHHDRDEVSSLLSAARQPLSEKLRQP